MAGVEDAAGTRRDGAFDRGPVPLDGLLAQLVHGNDEHLGRALEGVGEDRGVAEVARTYPYPLVGEVLRLAGVADAHSDLVRRHARAGAARALRAALPAQTTLSPAERQLLGEWLDRLAAKRADD